MDYKKNYEINTAFTLNAVNIRNYARIVTGRQCVVVTTQGGIQLHINAASGGVDIIEETNLKSVLVRFNRLVLAGLVKSSLTSRSKMDLENSLRNSNLL